MIVENLNKLRKDNEGNKGLDVSSLKVPNYQVQIISTLINDLKYIKKSLDELEVEFIKKEVEGYEFSNEFLFNQFKKNVELKGYFVGTIASAHYLFFDDKKQKSFLEQLICLDKENISWLFPPFCYGFSNDDIPNFEFVSVLGSTPSDAKRNSIIFCKTGLERLKVNREKFLMWPYVKKGSVPYIYFEGLDKNSFGSIDNHYTYWDGCFTEIKLARYVELLKELDKDNFYMASFVLYILLKMCGFKDDNIAWTSAMIEPKLIGDTGFYDPYDKEVRKPLVNVSYRELNENFIQVFEKLYLFENTRVFPNRVGEKNDINLK